MILVSSNKYNKQQQETLNKVFISLDKSLLRKITPQRVNEIENTEAVLADITGRLSNIHEYNNSIRKLVNATISLFGAKINEPIAIAKSKYNLVVYSNDDCLINSYTNEGTVYIIVNKADRFIDVSIKGY